MGREINPFGLRMPADLKERLQAEADRAGRSLNSEILMRLDASFGAAKGSGDLTARVADLERRMAVIEAASTKSKKPS